MVYKETINNKLIVFQVLEKGNNILRYKKSFINSQFKGKDRNEVMQKLKHNLINAYISVKVVQDARVIFQYEQLHSTIMMSELYEVILVMFENLQQYEVCDLILKILNKI